jgi:hypothetical protein
MGLRIYICDRERPEKSWKRSHTLPRGALLPLSGPFAELC